MGCLVRAPSSSSPLEVINETNKDGEEGGSSTVVTPTVVASPTADAAETLWRALTNDPSSLVRSTAAFIQLGYHSHPTALLQRLLQSILDSHDSIVKRFTLQQTVHYDIVVPLRKAWGEEDAKHHAKLLLSRTQRSEGTEAGGGVDDDLAAAQESLNHDALLRSELEQLLQRIERTALVRSDDGRGEEAAADVSNGDSAVRSSSLLTTTLIDDEDDSL